MTRYLYGGGGDGDIIRTTGLPFANSSANVHTTRTGASPVTDLQNVSGAATTNITTDVNGQALFYGPDNYIGVLWLDFGVGVRWALSPKDVSAAALQAHAVQRAADLTAATRTKKAGLRTNVADPLLNALAGDLDPLVEPRFASASLRDDAFPAPADGDRCYRTDLHCAMRYHGGAGRWVAQHDALIAEVTVTTPVTTVTFGAIPQAWRNLRMSYVAPRAVGSAAGSTIFQFMRAQFNGDQGNNYGATGHALRTKVSTAAAFTLHVDGDGAGGNTSGTAATYQETMNIRSSQQPGAYCGMVPGSAAPAGCAGGGELTVHNYAVASGSTSGIFSGGTGNDSSATVTGYHGRLDGHLSWGTGATASPAVTSLLLYLLGGGKFGTGTVISLYGMV